MTKILMICHGNICRSTMAEFVLKQMVSERGVTEQFHIASAGTSTEELGNDTHHGTKRKLTEMGIPFTKRKARQVTKADYEEYDFLVCMDNNNVRNLMRIIKDDPEGKVSLLLSFAGEDSSIADPWYSGDFDATYHDVTRGCEGLLKQIM